MNYVSQRLAARARTRQIDAEERADATANAIDRAAAAIWRQMRLTLRNASNSPFARHMAGHSLPFVYRRMGGIIDLTRQHLAKTIEWGHTTTAKALTGTLSANYLRVAALRRLHSPIVESQEVREDRDQLPPNPGFTELALDALGLRTEDLSSLLREPVRDEFSAEQQKEIFAALLFPPPDQDTLDEILYKPVQGVTWEDRLVGAIGGATPDKIETVVRQGFLQGKTPKEIERDLLPVVDGARASARRIARTESMRVSHGIQQKTWEGLGDLRIGWQIHATLDENTRSWHAARNGQIYYDNPKPGQKGLEECPDPPLEPDGTIAWS